MSPRRNRPPGSRGKPPPAGPDVDRARHGVHTVETWQGEQWRVQHIPGPAATKIYRCPGCDHEVRPGVPHVVVWPVDDAPGPFEADRRHWHTACWRARDRRRPTR